MKTTTTYEMISSFENALKSTTNAHNQKAYKFALSILDNLPDLEIGVRENTNRNAYNIGDLAEVAFKYHLNKGYDLRVSYSNETDLDRETMNEIKTFANSNRYPNGMETPSGFYAISEFGIHYITKSMVAKYWAEFRVNGSQKQPTLKVLKTIIRNESPQKLVELTNKMFG